MNDRVDVSSYWGKARPLSDVPFHAAWAHGLDVSAAGRALIRARPRPFDEVSRRLGWSLEDFEKLWLQLLALHDLGKFSHLFQWKVPCLYPADLRKPDGHAFEIADPDHPKAGLLLLTEWLDTDDPSHPPLLLGWENKHREPLLQPIFGHHGRPVARDCERDVPASYLFQPPAAAAALAYWREIDALLPSPTLDRPNPSALKAASWTIAGMTALADWIGSNQRWFPYTDPETPLATYWETACRQAEAAVCEAGLVPARTGPRLAFAALTGLPHAPSAAQAWADEVPLPQGPILVLIEDVTGGGKTEAALTLAHRIIASGQADGLFLALPTMATANAMFDRMTEIAPRLYRKDSHPSLALAHGRAALHAGFRRVATGFEDMVADDGGEEPDAAAVAPAWLASESRKALLADVGIGTIDQAVLAVLPNRYGSVRLAGLAGKVLIVDEAHAYDSYVGLELERLVAFHAASGGSTIVLSATLPSKTKGGILETWRKAIGAPRREMTASFYPLATLADATGGLAEVPLAARADLSRTVRITRVPDAAAAIDRIVAAAAAGACVAWIRNAVDDVIEGADALREAGLTPDLFHARFAMGDRLDIEKRVLRRFGKSSAAGDRRGQVIVTSQVAESSLDVDFDLVVTDLAPIDSILQRAGRLWRHTHRARPIHGRDLIVVAPDPAGPVDKDWVSASLPRTSYVYKDHGILWWTARELVARPNFRVPEDVRGAIEAVYSASDDDIPTHLQRVRNEAIGRAGAERSIADQNLLVFAEGYRPDGRGWQEEGRVATRLVEESRRIRLARPDGARLVPWRHDPDPRVAWALSEVTAYERKLRGRHGPEPRWREAAASARADWGRFEEDVLLLPLEQGADGNWRGVLTDEAGGSVAIGYSSSLGLQF